MAPLRLFLARQLLIPAAAAAEMTIIPLMEQGREAQVAAVMAVLAL